MKQLRVYAHHGPIPEAFLTPSHSLPLPGEVEPLVEYWCELSSQSFVDSPPGGVEPGYGPIDAVAPDQWRFDLGYGPKAVNFSVTGLCVLLVGATQAEYDFVLISPDGTRFQVPTGIEYQPLAPMPEWGDPEAPYTGIQACWTFADAAVAARGAWRIQVFQKESSWVPVEAAWANGITCVQLGDTPEAGYLAVEFTGVEVEPTTTTPAPTTTTTTTTPAPTTTTPAPTTTTPAPTTTTPAPTTTTPAPTTTTPTPTTTTTTPAPTTTTTTTTPPPLWETLGFFGKIFLIVALAITASAALSFFVWACDGYISLGLFTAAVSLAAGALVLLPTWTLLFRTGRIFDLLSLWFAVLSAGTPLLAAVLAIVGEFNCAAGALIASGLFGTIVSFLFLARRVGLRRAIRHGMRDD